MIVAQFSKRRLIPNEFAASSGLVGLLTSSTEQLLGFVLLAHRQVRGLVRCCSLWTTPPRFEICIAGILCGFEVLANGSTYDFLCVSLPDLMTPMPYGTRGWRLWQPVVQSVYRREDYWSYVASASRIFVRS